MQTLRFRQIHLDFHTSPQIPDIGAQFDKAHWQQMLNKGVVDSVTLFAKCHHGWSYHPTEVGEMHPHLNFDLLRQQVDACKEIDVNTPLYVSAGLDNVVSLRHPEWREISPQGFYAGWTTSPLHPGFHNMCFNTPYLDYLCKQIAEVTRLFPECDGIFLDIIHQNQCCCNWCLESMENQGYDAEKEEDRQAFADAVLEEYYRRTTEASRKNNPHMPVFHNSGHVPVGHRDRLKYFSHLELESLPTGGWGYDHFPMSAKYCTTLPHDVMGMTGKFHTNWGEFGGFKHPDALRYECAAMLAFGAKCSIGDQLHPTGKLDETTYHIVGQAYQEVKAKEPWCQNVESVADIGLLSSAACNECPTSVRAADKGAGRILLEGHFLFDVIDTEADFNKYRMLILPDDIPIQGRLKEQLDAYLSNGGKLMLTGASGVDELGNFVFDMGAECEGKSPYEPDYALPAPELQPAFCNSPMVMYMTSHRVKAHDAEVLGDIYDPYFNRDFRHFCSHQHAPHRPDPSGYAAGVATEQILYLAHPVFSIYRGWGAVTVRHYTTAAINYFLGTPTIVTNLPSTARVTMSHQPDASRYVIHLLYAEKAARGGKVTRDDGTPAGRGNLEIIEDTVPLRNTELQIKVPEKAKNITLQPQGQSAEYSAEDGNKININEFKIHQMAVVQY